MDRYIGLDAHTSSCTVATIGQSGKRLQSQVVETIEGSDRGAAIVLVLWHSMELYDPKKFGHAT